MHSCKSNLRRRSARTRSTSRPHAVPKKIAAKPKTEHDNKKADVIAAMSAPKEQPWAEIVKATGWRPYTVDGFVNILVRGAFFAPHCRAKAR